MLAQHLITKPVFDALFEDYSFASQNPVSQAMQGVLDVLNEHRLEKEADTLEKFYDSVRRRADQIDDITAKQKIVVELYDKFFRNAFPKMTERLGIVYTPVEVVDFIIHSINDLLQSEFGQTLGSKGVHIIDPFTGTGTFVTRLLQSGLIKAEELPYKYKHEIHANEIVLLAYYIAAINIEAVYHSLLKDKGTKYQPFEGICLTDTFQMYEKDDLVSDLMEHNSARRKRQKKLDIRVIMGNPPYSAVQDSENDNNKNVAYPALDARIRETYAATSSGTLKNALYDSYIRAIRWASDRIGKSGIIGFVTNAGFLEANAADGLRQCLAEEFSSIHIFHLRGNARTSGEQRRKEKDNVFGQGTRTPIAITLLVKNAAFAARAKILWHDIGDYLSQEEKLGIIKTYRSTSGITEAKAWHAVTPDAHHDWIKQRDSGFDRFILSGAKGSAAEPVVFNLYSSGVKTNRDAWCYNASRVLVSGNMKRMIEFYNSELDRYSAACDDPNSKATPDVNDFIDADPTKISWTREVKQSLERRNRRAFRPEAVVTACYRPFHKQWFYFDRSFNNCVYQMPKVFPQADTENRLIMIKQRWSGDGQLALMVDKIVDLQPDGGNQCFPLYLYEKATDDEDTDEGSLFARSKTAAKDADSYTRRDGISDAALAHFQATYPTQGEGDTITKEDLFYYIYGLLHSPDYRSRYADNLGKELPRIPAVKRFADFQAFSKAGRDLAHWHLNYETVECYKGVKIEGSAEFQLRSTTPAGKAANHPANAASTPTSLSSGSSKPTASTTRCGLGGPRSAEHYRVEKMKFAKTRDPETNKSINDKTTVLYNAHITLRDIPEEAYAYIVNGKPALEWVMERQSVTTDKDSGITNDANLWATETMNNPKYPLELFLRVITVSLETMKIVNGLPKLDI
jgi:predicted helicase